MGMLQHPSIDPIIISFGPLAIRWYGLAYIAGALLPLYVLKSLFRKYKLSVDDSVNYISYIMIGAILGGRVGYILFYDLLYYVQHPGNILAVWQGGMSYHGGAIGAIIASIIYAKRYSRSVLGLLDILSFGSTIGIFFGRLANFINAELYGRVTTVAWGMVFPNAGPETRHPSQLYEAFFEGALLFAVLLWVNNKYQPKPGILLALYMLAYGFSRFIIEFYRLPDAHLGAVLGPLSMGQLLCVLEILLGAVLLFRLRQVYTQQ